MKKSIGIVLLSSVVIAGCAVSDTSVIPMGGNKYQIVSTASSNHFSLQGGLDKANKICEEQGGKHASVISHNTIYQGVDKTAGAITDTFIKATAKDPNDIFLPTTRRSDDYKTTIVFSCR